MGDRRRKGKRQKRKEHQSEGGLRGPVLGGKKGGERLGTKKTEKNMLFTGVYRHQTRKGQEEKSTHTQEKSENGENYREGGKEVLIPKN